MVGPRRRHTGPAVPQRLQDQYERRIPARKTSPVDESRPLQVVMKCPRRYASQSGSFAPVRVALYRCWSASVPPHRTRRRGTRPVLWVRYHHRRGPAIESPVGGIDISALAIELIRDRRLQDRPFQPTASQRTSWLRASWQPKPFDFESWAVTRLPGVAPNMQQGGDAGIDFSAVLTTTGPSRSA